ncbi:MAG: hypothetical protein Alpg2KO_22810 [Alphaproteobacteria bacterium]
MLEFKDPFLISAIALGLGGALSIALYARGIELHKPIDANVDRSNNLIILFLMWVWVYSISALTFSVAPDPLQSGPIWLLTIPPGVLNCFASFAAGFWMMSCHQYSRSLLPYALLFGMLGLLTFTAKGALTYLHQMGVLQLYQSASHPHPVSYSGLSCFAVILAILAHDLIRVLHRIRDKHKDSDIN